jgi:acetyltransferase-like isoleucine patch superfamily enzyme
MNTRSSVIQALRGLFQCVYRVYGVRENVELGADVHIGVGSYLWAPNRFRVHDDVYIGKRCTIEVDGSIGSGTLLGNNVGLVGRFDHDHTIVGSIIRHAPWIGDSGYQGKGLGLEIVIEQDVWIGYGAIVLSGVRIGRGAVVAAGALVVSDVEPYAIVGGNPARSLGMRFTEAEIAAHEKGVLGRFSAAGPKGTPSVQGVVDDS